MNKLTLGFNLRTSRSLNRLWTFAEEALKHGHKIVFLDTFNKKAFTHLKNFGEIRVIRPNDISTQSDLNVIFTEDKCLNAPEGCPVVGLTHAHIPIAYDNKDKDEYCIYMEFLAGCDYLILGHNNLNKFKGSDFEELLSLSINHKTIRSSHAVLIPGGYPPLDSLIKKIERNSKKADTILFAPSINCNSHDDLNNMAAAELVSKIFPDKKIIYAPYPSQQDLQDGFEIVNALNRKNLFLIHEPQTTAELFTCSKILITDSSTTAFTYSMATLRPHIQCQFNGKRKEPTQTNTGWIVYSLSQLENILYNFQNSLDHYKHSLLEKRNQDYANIGHTAEYIIENIDIISKNKTLPNWLKVKRTTSNEYTNISDLEALAKIEKIPVGPRKKHIYFNQFTTICQGMDCTQSDCYKLIRCSKSIFWFYSYDLLVFEVSSNTLRFVTPIEFDKISVDEKGLKFFLRCDPSDSLSSFDFPEKFKKSNFAGYINFESCRPAGGIKLDEIFSSNSKFLILISSQSMYNRFSMVISLYLNAIANNIKIDVPPSAERLPIVLSLTKETLILPRWEVKKMFNPKSSISFMVWGCSNYYQLLRKAGSLPDMKNCTGFIDNNVEMHGKKVEGKKVYSLEQVIHKDPNPSIIVLAVSDIFIREIIEQIKYANHTYTELRSL